MSQEELDEARRDERAKVIAEAVAIIDDARFEGESDLRSVRYRIQALVAESGATQQEKKR